MGGSGNGAIRVAVTHGRGAFLWFDQTDGSGADFGGVHHHDWRTQEKRVDGEWSKEARLGSAWGDNGVATTACGSIALPLQDATA
jgi:hypothetical protein